VSERHACPESGGLCGTSEERGKKGVLPSAARTALEEGNMPSCIYPLTRGGMCSTSFCGYAAAFSGALRRRRRTAWRRTSPARNIAAQYVGRALSLRCSATILRHFCHCLPAHPNICSCCVCAWLCRSKRPINAPAQAVSARAGIHQNGGCGGVALGRTWRVVGCSSVITIQRRVLFKLKRYVGSNVEGGLRRRADGGGADETGG